MSSSASEFIDEPRTWSEMFVDAFEKHQSKVYLAGVLFFAMFSVVGVSIVAHVHVTHVGWVGDWEAVSGVSFAEDAFLFGLYINTSLYLLAFGASLYSLVDVR